MIYQLFGKSDHRTVAEVADAWRQRGYYAETKYRRGVYYLRLWQEPPANLVSCVLTLAHSG